MKIKGGLIWLPVGFLTIALGSKFIRGDGTQKTASVDTTPANEEISKLGETQLGKVFTTGDWTHTTPGKAIDGLLGAGWSNWIMWLLVATLIYWLIIKFVIKPKGSSDGIGGGAVTVMAFIALAAIVFSAVGNNNSKEAKHGVVEVNLKKATDRQEKEQRLTLNDTARVTGGYVLGKDGRPLADGVTAYGICAKVVEPAWLLTHPDTPKKQLEFVNNDVAFSLDMKFTKEMKTFLAQNDVATVTVSFYLVLTTVGVAPKC